eukprot:2952975-Alexandrium_andersonii.AAC.1
MSASLVGSEMCIRDSAGSASTDSAVNARSSPGRRSLPCSAAGGEPVSVSYTHLTLPTICSV